METATLFCIIAAFLCTWIVPVIFAVLTGRKVKGYITALFSGALGGIIAAIVSRSLSFGTSGLGGILLTALFTAVFFTALRAVMFKAASLVGDSVLLGYAVGIGQGMAAQIIAVGMLFLNNTVYGTMLYIGTLESTLTNAGLSGEQAAAMASTLANTPAYMYLMSGFEQLLLVIVMVLCGFVISWFAQQKKLWLGIGLSFAAELLYRLVMLLLTAYASSAVQYMALTLLLMVALFLVYMSLLKMANISLKPAKKQKA